MKQNLVKNQGRDFSLPWENHGTQYSQNPSVHREGLEAGRPRKANLCPLFDRLRVRDFPTNYLSSTHQSRSAVQLSSLTVTLGLGCSRAQSLSSALSICGLGEQSFSQFTKHFNLIAHDVQYLTEGYDRQVFTSEKL
ncbi:Atp-Binding Cassette Sub-Family A Member 13 [Manis pentadactyla]|nr:Atp-Binding Cassette Sub-Family A Member 13 [Manis pentadactyla]